MAHPTPLKFLMPGWFSLVMGLSGLALAWHATAPVLGERALGVALVLASAALLVFVLLALASLLRWQRHTMALAEDLRHPVRHAFVAAIPVSLLLLVTLGQRLGFGDAALSVLWWPASLAQFGVTLWVMGRWLSLPAIAADGASQASGLWPGITPVLFIPVVGNAVAPLAGVNLGHEVWSAAQFGIGMLLWPVVLGLILVRRMAHSPLPERLLPTWFITVAPPAVIGLSLLQFQAPSWVAQAFWGVALFSLLWTGSLARRMVAQPFSLAFWALSFPLAAFTALTLRLADIHGQPGLQNAGMLLLAMSSLVVAGLLLATVRGLRNGTLLAPEPVASIVPATP
jgi:tellurite resistance protein